MRKNRRVFGIRVVNIGLNLLTYCLNWIIDISKWSFILFSVDSWHFCKFRFFCFASVVILAPLCYAEVLQHIQDKYDIRLQPGKSEISKS